MLESKVLNLSKENQEQLDLKNKTIELEAKSKSLEATIQSLLAEKTDFSKLIKDIELLKKEVAKKDQMIRLYNTSGISQSDLIPMGLIESNLAIRQGEAARLLAKIDKKEGSGEYLKLLFRQFKVLRQEREDMFLTNELTRDGQAVFDQMQSVDRFFDKFPSYHDLSNMKDPLEYDKNVKSFRLNWQRFIRWHEILALAVNATEAFGYGVMYYGVKEIDDLVDEELTESEDLEEINFDAKGQQIAMPQQPQPAVVKQEAPIVPEEIVIEEPIAEPEPEPKPEPKKGEKPKKKGLF